MAAAIAAIALSYAGTAAASDDEAYAIAAYALVTGGGIVTSIGMQANLLAGEPDMVWARVGAGFGGANAALGAGFLIASGLVSDDETARLLAILGGTHFAIAAADTLWGLVTYAATEDAFDLATPRPRTAGFRYRVTF